MGLKKKETHFRLTALLLCAVMMFSFMPLQSIRALADSTDEPAYTCGKAEHIHGPECYETQRVLTCGLEEESGPEDDVPEPGTEPDAEEESGSVADEPAESETDTGSETESQEEDSAADSTKGPTDEPAESEAGTDTGSEAAGHEEDPAADTAEGSESAKPHVHTDTCYEDRTILICGIEEHIHTDSCLTQSGDDPGSEGQDSANSIEMNDAGLDAAADGAEPSVTVGGTEYPQSDFRSMADLGLIVGAKLESDGVSYDLMDPNTDTSTIGLYRGFAVDVAVRFTNRVLASGDRLYFWKMPSAHLGEAVSGDITDEDGVVYGEYVFDTDGSVYAVLNDTGMSQSVLDWGFRVSAEWDRDTGPVRVDLGGGNVIDVDLDRRRADVVKNGSRIGPGRYSYTSRIYALDELSLTSIDDIVTIHDWFKGFQAWCQKAQVPIAEACHVQDVKLSWPGPDGATRELSIGEDHVLVDTAVPDTDNGCPRIKYHMELDDPIPLPKDGEAVLTYQFWIDPELVRYLDLIDTLHYRFDNEVRAYLDDGTYASDDAIVRDNERDLIGKECVQDGDTAEWTVSVAAPAVYTVAGMLVTDELVRELDYLPDRGFTVSYGDTVLTPEVHMCASSDEFDASSAAGVVYVFDHSFKYLIPEGPGPDNGLEMKYRTTFDEAIIQKYGSHRLNQAFLVDTAYGESDSHGDVYPEGEIRKYNDGIHVDGEGRLYTNWSVEIAVPAGMECEQFTIEDYVPEANGHELYDTLHVPDGTFAGSSRVSVYSSDSSENTGYDPDERLAELGFDVSIVTASGQDVTWDKLYRVQVRDVRAAHNGDHYFTVTLADEWHYKHKYDNVDPQPSEKIKNGIAAMDEDCVVTLTYAMYLNGDAGTFQEHENKAVWYYNDEYANMDGKSALELYYINNDKYLSNEVVGSRTSEDGSKMVLTYQARYNMYDRISRNGWVPGTGYTFGPDLKETKYAAYVPGSVKVYWTETIDGDARWAYDNPGSPYDGETDLLKILEDVSHTGGPNGPLATLVSESDFGFRVSIPYYKRTGGFYWKDDGGQGRFYSPLFEYEVEVDLAAMEADKDYRYRVEDTFKSFLTDGTLDAVADAPYDVNTGALDKKLTQRPCRENGYVARYEIVVDDTSDKVRALDPLDVIDAMESPAMRFLPDETTVEYSIDGAAWSPLDAGRYRLMYDAGSGMLTCRLVGTRPGGHYRIGYAVRFSGQPGDKLSVSNSAWLAGFKDQYAGIESTFEIEQVSSSASGSMAAVEIVKYNADNVGMRLEGVEFTLSRVSGTMLYAISELGSRDEVLEYLDANSGWRKVASAKTDMDGRIRWENGTNGVELSMDRLFRLEETGTLPGYGKLEEPIYFYLSATNEAYGADDGGDVGYLRWFADSCEPYQTVIPIGNARASVVLEKQDKNTGELLAGAGFALYPDEACADAGSAVRAVDHGDGTYYFGDLEMGRDYYLKEEQAPAGYLLDGAVYTVRISDAGVVSVNPALGMTSDGHYVFVDEAADMVLPKTGGSGAGAFLWAGIAMAVIAAVCAALRKASVRRATLMLTLVLALVMSSTAVCACGDAIGYGEWPQLDIDVPSTANRWDRVTVSASASNADSVSWRLLRDGWAVSTGDFTEAGGSFIADSDGTYILVGTARRGSVSTMHTREIRVGPGSDKAGVSEIGVNRRSIYSWDGSYVKEAKEDIVRRVMSDLDCDTIYQAVPSAMSDAEVLGFLDRRAADGHRVYYLCGDSSWAVEPDAASMKAELERVIRWNEEAGKSGRARFYGIQYDVEKLSSQAAVNQVVENYKAVYAVAGEHGIKVEACIAYNLDSRYGFNAQLEDLVANGCDSIAVMNYAADEAENIKNEAALCRKYGKGIVNITEMQPVGSHGLTASQTYGDDGIQAVEDMWLRLQARYGNGIGFSYHYLDPVLELLP